VLEKKELKARLKSSQTLWPIEFKVTTVDGEYTRDAFALGHPHQGGIREIHRKVSIFPHELAHSRTVAGIQLHQGDTTDSEYVPKCALGFGRRLSRYIASVKAGQTVPKGSGIL
jgi:hypothetical protein